MLAHSICQVLWMPRMSLRWWRWSRLLSSQTRAFGPLHVFSSTAEATLVWFLECTVSLMSFQVLIHPTSFHTEKIRNFPLVEGTWAQRWSPLFSQSPSKWCGSQKRQNVSGMYILKEDAIGFQEWAKRAWFFLTLLNVYSLRSTGPR